ncbi:MAG: hypothetical protein ABSA84_05065 [Gammaproteobacteria bacterium]
MPPKAKKRQRVEFNLEEFVQEITAFLDEVGAADSIDDLYNLILSKDSWPLLKEFFAYITAPLSENPLTEDEFRDIITNDRLEVIISLYTTIFNRLNTLREPKHCNEGKPQTLTLKRIKLIFEFLEHHIAAIKNFVNLYEDDTSKRPESFRTLSRSLLRELAKHKTALELLDVSKNSKNSKNSKSSKSSKTEEAPSLSDTKQGVRKFGRDKKKFEVDKAKLEADKAKLEADKAKFAKDKEIADAIKVIKRYGLVVTNVELAQATIAASSVVKPEQQEKVAIKSEKTTDDPANVVIARPAVDRTWFDEGQIDRVLNYLFENDIRNNNVRVVPAFDITTETGLEMLQDAINGIGVQNREKKEECDAFLQPANTIIVPVNLGNMHWVAVYIHFNTLDRTSPVVRYVDPFGEPMVPEFIEVIRGAYPNMREEAIDYPIQLQGDTYNCGPWTIAILNSLVHHEALPDEYFDINAHREIYLDIWRGVPTVSRGQFEHRLTARIPEGAQSANPTLLFNFNGTSSSSSSATSLLSPPPGFTFSHDQQRENLQMLPHSSAEPQEEPILTKEKLEDMIKEAENIISLYEKGDESVSDEQYDKALNDMEEARRELRLLEEEGIVSKGSMFRPGL